jgi:hypothetical protein
VYNGAETIKRSIQSILSQTFGKLELIVIDDASTDDSVKIIMGFSDERLIAIRNDVNIGLAATLNLGISSTRGRYICRQDQDDFSDSHRIRDQINFLEANEDVVLLGSRAVVSHLNIAHRSARKSRLNHPLGDSSLQWYLLFGNPFVHSSVVFRRSAITAIGSYETDISRGWPEDYELWSRMSQVGKIANLKSHLVHYTASGSGMSNTHSMQIQSGVLRIAGENLQVALRVNGSETHAWREVVTILNGFRNPDYSCRTLLYGMCLLLRTAKSQYRREPSFELMRVYVVTCVRFLRAWTIGFRFDWRRDGRRE